MKSDKLLPLLLFLISITSGLNAQTQLEKGYFIDNDNLRTECLIKNSDWLDNPASFIYTSGDEGDEKKADTSTVREFGIYNKVKFIRIEADIDRSSDNNIELSRVRTPIWSHETLFVKVLVEGKASLYFYQEGLLKRFFYSVDGSPITQLVYKRYWLDGHVIGNERFRQQLFLDMKFSENSEADIRRLSYTQKDLVNYFAGYNSSFGETMTAIHSKESGKVVRDVFNLRLTPGISLSSLDVLNSFNGIGFNTGNSVTFTIGTEAEFILPYNNNKWGLLFEPGFQYLNYESGTNKVSYSFIDFPVGLRYYLFLNTDTRIFVNGHFIPNYCLDFGSKISTAYSELDFKSQMGFSVGTGISMNRFSAEFRYYFRRNLADGYTSWYANYEKISLIAGYRLFKKTTGTR